MEFAVEIGTMWLVILTGGCWTNKILNKIVRLKTIKAVSIEYKLFHEFRAQIENKNEQIKQFVS